MILTFQNVGCEAPAGREHGLTDATFALAEGDLMLLRVRAGQEPTPVADLAQGVWPPVAGVVTFLGEDWQALGPDRAAAQRSRIGRVYAAGSWLSNLDVDENITLAQRYHTDRTEAAILEEARALAESFGLGELPSARPHAVPRDALRRAQWVRAFLGGPRLLLFDPVIRDEDAQGVDLLLAKVAEARKGGAAVVWVTADAADWTDARLNPTLKFELKGPKMSAQHTPPG